MNRSEEFPQTVFERADETRHAGIEKFKVKGLTRGPLKFR
jgi:hypothetical protein